MTTTLRSLISALMASLLLAFIATVSPAAENKPSDPALETDHVRAKVAADAEAAMARLGGVRLVIEVDAAALRARSQAELRDEVYRVLREERVPATGRRVRDDGVELRIADVVDRERFLAALQTAMGETKWLPRPVSATLSDDGTMRLALSEQAAADRLRDLVRAAMAMIEQRLGDGSVKPGLESSGESRIVLLLPGAGDAEPIAASLGKRAQVNLRLVDESVSPEDAREHPPEGSELLEGLGDHRAYLISRQVSVDGEDFVDAAPGLDRATSRPIVNMRLDARGARHLASVTQANVGRPLAVVLDGAVIAAPIIREPITRGTLQISGEFTVQQVDAIAMKIRSATLAGRLAVVDKQVVAAGSEKK